MDSVTTEMLKVSLFAAEAHKFQKRKSDGSSYICHPFRVMNILLDAGCLDINTLKAALLHDVVEDTDVTLEEIKEKFGKTVSSIVSEVSNEKGLTKLQRKMNAVERCRKMSKSAKLVKLADKIDNCRDLIENPIAGWTKIEIDGYIALSWICIKEMNIKRVSDGFYPDTISVKLIDQFIDIAQKRICLLDSEKILSEYYEFLQQ